ncbi:hypothetical protein ONS95_004147 [Cadophora gregata]|uniref:uncharacterized protein n=1 Tax=Cadophora gregata TaxID=51156 RepID=UPI0026DBEE0C|nr:uncharacterized protein ONS95_004147 [Cadophora gregata]KAK0105491.1 hypothetical protein ONS96_004876 [Cadophora gregata f. sp. sojae]KAK0105617.1 hypothetical protein ONS95_004147 [Cadophora gregata]
MAPQGWRRLAQDNPDSESTVGAGSPRRKRPLFSSKKIAIAAAVTLIALALLYSSHRLVADGYSFRKEPPQNPASEEPANLPPRPSTILSTSKAAVIVENRPLENLIPIILHFSSVLGREWPIHLFTSEGNMGAFSESAPFQREVSAGRFHVRALPAEEHLNTHAAVSGFFTKPWFWEQMAPAEHILMFQADSIICSNSQHRVEDFLMYDFVGAPVDEVRGLGMGYNGGLSIRNRTKCLEIVQNYDWQVERHGDHSAGNVDYEDQWFSKKMREMPGGSTLPTPEIAMQFSVETMWYDKPLGYHQPNVWQKEHMDEIYKWCPEYRLCTLETFTDHNTENFGGA